MCVNDLRDGGAKHGIQKQVRFKRRTRTGNNALPNFWSGLTNNDKTISRN